REKMHHFIRRTRNHVFLDERFDSVCSRLQETKRPHAIWAIPILNAPQPLPLENRRDCKKRREHSDNPGNGYYRRDKRLPRLGCESRKRMIQIDKNLVERIGHLSSRVRLPV